MNRFTMSCSLICEAGFATSSNNQARLGKPVQNFRQKVLRNIHFRSNSRGNYRAAVIFCCQKPHGP